MCTQKPPHDFSQQLYDKYKEAFDDYIRSTVVSLFFFVCFGFKFVTIIYMVCSIYIVNCDKEENSILVDIMHILIGVAFT